MPLNPSLIAFSILLPVLVYSSELDKYRIGNDINYHYAPYTMTTVVNTATTLPTIRRATALMDEGCDKCKTEADLPLVAMPQKLTQEQQKLIRSDNQAYQKSMKLIMFIEFLLDLVFPSYFATHDIQLLLITSIAVFYGANVNGRIPWTAVAVMVEFLEQPVPRFMRYLMLLCAYYGVLE